MVSLYTLIGLLPWSSPSGSQFLLICGKPRFARLPSMSHTLPRLVLRFTQTSCAGQEERTVAPHCRRSAARFTLTLCSGRCPRPLLAVRGQISVRRCAPHAVSIAPPTAPDVGGVQDRHGLSAMSCPLRTSAHGSLTVGYRLASPRRHPTFATAKPTHPALSVIPIAPCTSIRRRKCLRLRLVARHGRRYRKRIRQPTLQSGIGLLRRTDTRLAFTTSAQCSVKPVPQRLCRASGTLSAVNRLALHSHSLQAQCFAAGASSVVGGVSLPEVLHYARRTPSASPPFEHSPTSPNHEITASSLAVISLADRQSGAVTAHSC